MLGRACGLVLRALDRRARRGDRSWVGSCARSDAPPYLSAVARRRAGERCPSMRCKAVLRGCWGDLGSRVSTKSTGLAATRHKGATTAAVPSR